MGIQKAAVILKVVDVSVHEPDILPFQEIEVLAGSRALQDGLRPVRDEQTGDPGAEDNQGDDGERDQEMLVEYA